MKNLREGQKAPKFKLTDKDGKSFEVGKQKTSYLVLYFYPKDNTPGCTIECKEFSEHLHLFAKRDTAVIGISGGDQKSKAKFCAKHDLTVPLVSDTDFAVSTAYGVYGEKKFMGRTFNGIHRTTFIIDKKGEIVRIFDEVKAKGHAEEVLAAIDELRKR